eukprot:scaffold9134_cov170-Amphora_coffeaeformis.AAC.2
MAGSILARAVPSDSNTRPLVGGYKPANICAKVDLPLPFRPTSATTRPLGTVKEISFKMGAPVDRYAKLTCSKEMDVTLETTVEEEEGEGFVSWVVSFLSLSSSS